MLIVDVIPVKKRRLSHTLSYFCNVPVSRGQLVSIPLRKKIEKGIVIGVYDASSMKQNIKQSMYSLRSIVDVHNMMCSEVFLDVLLLMTRRYMVSLDAMFAAAFPALYQTMESIRNGITSPFHEHAKRAFKHHTTVVQGTLKTRLQAYLKFMNNHSLQHGCIVCPTKQHAELISITIDTKLDVFVLHSGTTKKQAHNAMNHIHSGKPYLLVCTPSFFVVGTLAADIVIIEEESHHAYQPNTYYPFHWVSLCVMYAAKVGIPLVVGATQISINARIALREGFASTHKKEDFDLVPRTPKTIIFDHANLEAPSLLHPKTLQLLSDVPKQASIFVFVPMRGLASVLVCQDCGFVVTCDECDAGVKLVSYQGDRFEYCKSCDLKRTPQDTCPVCGGARIHLGGTTLDRVVEKLQGATSRPLLSVAKELTQTKKGLQQIHDARHSHIILGTRSVLDNTSMDFDYSISLSLAVISSKPVYDAYEQTLRLASELLARTRLKAFFESRNMPKLIQHSITSGSVFDWVQEELSIRKRFQYPGYSTLITVRDTDISVQEITACIDASSFNGRVTKQPTGDIVIMFTAKEWFRLLRDRSLTSEDRNVLQLLYKMGRTGAVIVDDSPYIT